MNEVAQSPSGGRRFRLQLQTSGVEVVRSKERNWPLTQEWRTSDHEFWWVAVLNIYFATWSEQLMGVNNWYELAPFSLIPLRLFHLKRMNSLIVFKWEISYLLADWKNLLELGSALCYVKGKKTTYCADPSDATQSDAKWTPKIDFSSATFNSFSFSRTQNDQSRPMKVVDINHLQNLTEYWLCCLKRSHHRRCRC